MRLKVDKVYKAVGTVLDASQMLEEKDSPRVEAMSPPSDCKL